MAAPSSILTRQGELIIVSNINRVAVSGTTLSIYHSDGSTTAYQYQTAANALSDLDIYSAILEAKAAADPTIYTVTPTAILQTTLPQTISISGIAFHSSAALYLSNYAGTGALVTTFVNSTALTAPVPATFAVGTYDVVYSDSNGAVFRATTALVLY